MRWSPACLALLLATTLAGCTDETPEPLTPAVVAHVPDAEPEFRFSLFGRSNVTENDRSITVRLFYEGQIFHFVAFEARPDSDEPERLEEYMLPSGFVSWDVVADGNQVSGAGMDPSECASGRGLAIVEVSDENLRWHGGGIKIEYGCGV